MNTKSDPQTEKSVWSDENVIKNLQKRIKTFYNIDYFDGVVLPLLDIPLSGRVLDVGCGYDGLYLTLAGLRPDLYITGVDVEENALNSAAILLG